MVRWAVALWVCLSPLVWAASPEALHARNGAATSRSLIASEVGVDMMRAGGNAIDAAVATGFALAVTYPSAGNIGGGGFLVIHLADGTVVTNDHRETAPAAASRDMYLDEDGELIKGSSTETHLAVGVPGTVAGLLDALEKYGKLDRKTVLAPAIRLAAEGFPLSYDLARQFQRRQPQFARWPQSLEVFTNKGEPWQEGEMFRQPDLAATLQRISDHGRAGFYEGRTADLLVAEMQENGGLITHADLAGYRSQWREPVRFTYRGHEIVSMPPPSSGGLLIANMLKMLEPYDLAEMGFGSAQRMHLMIEAERRAYADRAEHLGDPDFYPVPFDMFLSDEYARKRMESFNPEQASDSEAIFAGNWPAESPDTTHASFADAAGNAVAYTTTLNLSYGSKIVAAGTGVLLNNEMDDFSARENTPNAFGLLGREANAIEPGKRMLSSMTPTIVLREGRPWLITGSPGGSTIITTTMQVIINAIDHGMDVADAVGQPRFHHQWKPNRVILERFGISPDTRRLLVNMGHESLIEIPWGRGIGDANSIMITDDGIEATSDPRNDGGAAGF